MLINFQPLLFRFHALLLMARNGIVTIRFRHDDEHDFLHYNSLVNIVIYL